MNQERLKHLEFVQNIITRMNTNSFQIKSLSITIVSALLAIYVTTQINKFLLIAVFPIIIFWFLDSYYLQQERKFRGLYNDIIKKPKDKIKLFEIRPDLYKRRKFSFFNAFFSKTIILMYLPLIVILSIIYILMS